MINVDTDIDEIKTLHMGLFDELQDNAGYYRANQEARDAFVTRVRSLLSRIRERAGQPLEASQYYWMRDAIKAWQIAFAAILQVGEHVEALPGFQKTTVNKQLTASDITHMVDAYANRRYQERKEESREAELLRMQRTFFMSTEDEYKEDTFSATVWLASEFLFNEYDGIDLQGAPSKDLLEFLSRVWLHDVTRFRAFLHWEKTQRPAPGDPIANYFWF